MGIRRGRGTGGTHEETAAEIDSYGQFQARGDGLTISGRDEWHAAAIEFVRAHRPTPERHGHAGVADAVVGPLVDRPDAFAGCGDAVHCHGWATPEHVAVADGRVACAADFEHALAAPGEFDYRRTVAPTFGSTDGDDARERSRAGYGSSVPSGTGPIADGRCTTY